MSPGTDLALDDTDRPKSRNAPGEAGQLACRHHLVDVLVRERCLFGQALDRRSAHRNAGLLQLVAQIRAANLALRLVPAQCTSSSMAGREEGAPRLYACQHI